MLRDLKRLGRETAVYGLSTVVGRMLNFLLLPLYTHALSPAQYGIVATLFTYIAFGNVLYGHGMDFSFMRHYEEPENRASAFSTAYWSLAAAALAITGLLLAFARPATALGGLEGNVDLVRYAAWIMAFDALTLVPFALLRMNHRAGLYAGVKVANIAMNVALNYALLVRVHLGMRGVFLASLLTSAATLAILAPVTLSELRPRFDWPLYRHLLRFGLPIIPAGLASMMVQVIDRPILKFMTNDATVGIYQANYRLGIFMMMVVNMFDAAWRPFFLQRAGQPDAERVLGRVLTYFVAGSSLLYLVIDLFIPHVVSLPLLAGKPLIHPAYWPGLAIVPVVTLGYLFNGMYINFLAPVTLAKRSELVTAATAVGAAVNVGANLWWIPRWGMMGAALATLAAYAVMAAVLYALGRRLLAIPYEWSRLLHAAAVLALISGGAHLAGFGMAADRPWQRLGLLLAFPAILVATGFLDADERHALRARLTR